MKRAGKPEIINAAANVVEAQIAVDHAEKAGDDAKRYRDALASCVYSLRWLIERDRPEITARFRSAEAVTK
jgi:hypothetical protein